MKPSSFVLLGIFLCLFVAYVSGCASDNDCTGDNWCSECGTCTVGSVGATCCSDNDCSGSNCCDYCSRKCTPTLSNCDARTCSSSTSTSSSSSVTTGSSGCGTYTVVSGDTLSGIAAKYGNAFTAQQLCSYNGLPDCDAIDIGQVLNIPCSGSVTSTTTHSTTKSSSTSTTGSSNPNYNKTISGVKITSYGWNDNDDGSGGFGNDIIAFTNVRHGHAVETSGTYSDPCTFATDQNELAPGSIIYLPHVKKYYIMEDECAECDNDWNNGKYHVDLWIGPNSATLPADPLYNCEGAISKSSGQIIINPDPNLQVTTTKIFSGGVCHY